MSDDLNNQTDWLYPLEWGQTLNFDWFAFHINRFLNSKFVSKAVSQDKRAAAFTAVILWNESFRQDPAGTLPADDRDLALLAKFGTDVKGWLQVRDDALYGWMPVTIPGDRHGEADQRLGHAMVAHEAQEMWKRKDNSAERNEAKKIANLRNRVKNQLKHLGCRASTYNNKDAVAKIASWLSNADLKITADNVGLALEKLADHPAEIASHPQWKKGYGGS